jgi:hypothetical protein
MATQRNDRKLVSSEIRKCRRLIKQVAVILLTAQIDTAIAAKRLVRRHPHLLPVLFPNGLDHGS